MIKVYLNDIDERFIIEVRQTLVKYDIKFNGLECIVFNPDNKLKDILDGNFVLWENYN
jgi:hypothetical protein